MLLELVGLRRILGPVMILGYFVVLGLNFMHWKGEPTTYFNDMYVVNEMTMVFNAVILTISVFIVLMAGDFIKHEKDYWSDYLSILTFAICGAMVMIGAHHLLMTFIGIEILSVSLYVLAGSNRTKTTSNEAGMKYFLMGAFASGVLLFGMVLLYGAVGSLHYHKLNKFLFSHTVENIGFLYSGLVLILVGFFFKISAVPFHFWSPDVYQGSPSLVTAFMATVAKISAIGTLYIVLNQIFIPLSHFYDIVLIIISIATISIGNILAIVQENFKRILAYSGISHAGFMLLGILAVDFNHWHVLAYYTMAYALGNLIAFGVSMLVFKSMGHQNISAFNGLFMKKPVLSICLTLAMLSLASIPPLAGFWSKYYVLSYAVTKGLLPLVIIAVINTVLSIYFYFKVIVAMYARVPNSQPIKVSYLFFVVVIFSTILLIALGLLPDLAFRLI